jgi:anhydro-N-acetylmuramic acid kinase
MDKAKMENGLNSPLTVIGLMSGTSADGIDAALLQTDGETITHFGHTYHKPYPDLLKTMILQAYGRVPGPEAALLEKIITEQHAQAVETLLERAGYTASDIDLIGFHGQTLFHQPPQIRGEKGQTHIIGDGALLSSLTGITVVDQFRLNDIAEGGQGAPLVPIFHRALAKDLPKPLAFLNIGGVANVTWLGENDEDIIAFDTGPGNGLIDDWVRTYCSLPWDEDGKIAAKGTVHSDILRSWLFHPYLSQRPPKALDRKQFSKCLEDVTEIPFEDAIATLTAFTVRAIEKALPFFPEKPKLWLVAGGGAHNGTLLNLMRERLEVDVKRVTDIGLDGDALEAQAFGFLAVRSMRNYPLTFPGTTGVPYPLSGGRICRYEKAQVI